MPDSPGVENAVELAARRLERAITLLEPRVAQRISQASDGAGSALNADRSQLAADLDTSRARERELVEAGAEASAALANAIAQIKEALGAPKGG